MFRKAVVVVVIVLLVATVACQPKIVEVTRIVEKEKVVEKVVTAALPSPTPTFTPRPTVTSRPFKQVVTPTPGWTSYEGEGVVLKLSSEDAVLPLDGGEWLFKAVVINPDKDLTYRLYVSNLGTKYGSSVADLKRFRKADPKISVLSEGSGKAGKREFYRIVTVSIPPDPDPKKNPIHFCYYFYHEKQLITVEFECFSCGKVDVDKHFSYWEEIVFRIELN